MPLDVAATLEAAGKDPPRLAEAHYRATLEGDGLTGSAEWKVKHSYDEPGRLSLALEGTWRPASAWRVEARVGTARDRLARSDSTTWTLAAERTLGESFEARAELIGDDRSRPWTGVTLRWRIWPEHAVLSLSGGVRAGPLRERRAGLGLTFEF